MKVRPTSTLLAFSILALIASSGFGQKPEPPPKPPDTPTEIKKPPIPANLPGKELIPARGMPTPPGTIEKPADPKRVRSTYELNGARVDITEGDFYACHQRLEAFEPKNTGRSLSVERVYEQILGYAEAKALGLDASPEEIALFDPLAANPALKTDAEARWAKQGVTQEMYDIYQRETRTIQKAKDLFLNSARVLSGEVFEAYRRDHFTYRLEYVEFPAAKFADEIKNKPPSDKELEEFYKSDKGVQQLLRGTSNVTAEFVSFDPTVRTASTEPGQPITRAEALEYYAKNKSRLDTLIPSNERATMYPAGTPALNEVKTPFSILSKLGIIENEIRLTAKMRTAFEAAKKPAADLKLIASTSGLQYERIEKVDRDVMAAKYGKYGPQIFSILFNQNPGDLSSDLRMEPQIQFFYRLVEKEGANLPDFARVKDQVLKPYTETMSLRAAQAAAQALRSAIDKKVDGEIHAEEETLLGAAQAAAEAEIKTKNVTDPKETESIKAKHRQMALNNVRMKKDGLAAKDFDAEVKARGLTLIDTGPFDLMAQRQNMGGGDDAARRRFLVTNPILRNMEPGQVSQVLTDANSKTNFLVKLAERSEPDYSTMPDGELLAIKSQTERARSFQPVQRWQYQDIMRRRDLKIL